MFPISIFINILLVVHVMVSLLIILIVLMQRPKNEGLGAAFGGGMTENLFGAQTTNVLQTITRWLGGMFFVLTLVLSILYVRQGGSRSAIQEKLSNVTVPAAATPVPSTPVPIAGKESRLGEKEKFELGTEGSESTPESEPDVKLQVSPKAVTPPLEAPPLPTPEPVPTACIPQKAPNPAPSAPGSENAKETPAKSPPPENKSKEPASAPANPAPPENKPGPPAEPPK